MPKAKKYYFTKAWKLFSLYTRQKDKDWRDQVKCFTCNWRGNWKECDAGHYIHGKGKELYFEEKNVHAQCIRCNKYLGGNLGRYAYELIQKYGQNEYVKLEKRRYREKYWGIKDLKKIIEKYELFSKCDNN